MVAILSTIVVLILAKEVVVTYRRERGYATQCATYGDCKTLPFETELDDERVSDRSEMILDRVREQGEITNDMVQAMFKVSHTTAWRYLEALEKEGKLQQNGAIGHTVHYTAL